MHKAYKAVITGKLLRFVKNKPLQDVLLEETSHISDILFSRQVLADRRALFLCVINTACVDTSLMCYDTITCKRKKTILVTL